jgi:hypothetical protein
VRPGFFWRDAKTVGMPSVRDCIDEQGNGREGKAIWVGYLFLCVGAKLTKVMIRRDVWS